MVTAPTQTQPAIQAFRLHRDDTVYGLFPNIMCVVSGKQWCPFFSLQRPFHCEWIGGLQYSRTLERTLLQQNDESEFRTEKRGSYHKIIHGEY